MNADRKLISQPSVDSESNERVSTDRVGSFPFHAYMNPTIYMCTHNRSYCTRIVTIVLIPLFRSIPKFFPAHLASIITREYEILPGKLINARLGKPTYFPFHLPRFLCLWNCAPLFRGKCVGSCIICNAAGKRKRIFFLFHPDINRTMWGVICLNRSSFSEEFL